MSEQKTGQEVVAQARDDSFLNTEPLVAKAAVVGIVTSICIALGAFGLISEDQRDIIVDQVGSITVALFVLAPIIISAVNALWGRLSAFSPRSAAKIAVSNAANTTGVPTLSPPP